jgi:hypothetical protein
MVTQTNLPDPISWRLLESECLLVETESMRILVNVPSSIDLISMDMDVLLVSDSDAMVRFYGFQDHDYFKHTQIIVTDAVFDFSK